MATIAILNAKGGVGKTTITINVGSTLHDDGLGVCLVDADLRKPDLAQWYAEALEDDKSPPPVRRDGRDLLAEPETLKGLADVVIVDCPAIDDEIARFAAHSADLILVPTQPKQRDLQNAGVLFTRLAQAGALERTRLIVNRFDKRKGSHAHVLAELREHAPCPVLETMLRDLTDYDEADLERVAVTRYKPKGGAAKEVRALTDEIKGLING